MMESYQHQQCSLETAANGGATGDDSPFRHFNRARGRGLLPLKKRRLMDAYATTTLSAPASRLDINTPHLPPASPTADARSNSCVNIIAPSPHLGGIGGGGGGGADEKIAALALVAAASGSSSSATTDLTPAAAVCSFSTDPYITASDVSTTSTSHSAHFPASVVSSRSLLAMAQVVDSQRNLSEQQTPQYDDVVSSSSPPGLHEREQQKQEGHSCAETEHCAQPQQEPAAQPQTTGTSRQRVHHPPLTSPLPGGCHGRTSRNNSYCRRIPCYNGSKYCKLHYQQLVLNAGGATNVDGGDLSGQQQQQQQEAAPPAGRARSGNGRTPAAAAKSSDAARHSHSSKAPHQHPHQDKRYTDGSAESPCGATTTRGRPCAYVAVGGTRYCHLHADFDTNPPPRRGGCGGGSAGGEASAKIPGRSSTLASGSGQGSNAARTSSVTGQLRGPLAKQPSKHQARENSIKASATDVSNKTQSKEVHLPYPLLNSIPSDQWSNKLVLISTGPLVNHLGRVVKWGNGWITVRTTTSGENEDGGGCSGGAAEESGLLHNRRAIELYLLPDGQGGQMGQPTEGEGKEEDGGAADTDVNAKDDAHATSSREAASGIGDSSEKAQWSAEKECRDEKMLPTVTHARGPSRLSQNDGSTSFEEREEVEGTLEISTPHGRGEEEIEGGKPEAKAADETNARKDMESSSAKSASLSPSKANAPTSPSKRHMYSDVSLAEALSRAQEGGKMHTIDVLFGTAALERRRRTIHKPKRYEDKAMIERKKSDGQEPMTSPSRKNSGGGVCGGSPSNKR